MIMLPNSGSRTFKAIRQSLVSERLCRRRRRWLLALLVGLVTAATARWVLPRASYPIAGLRPFRPFRPAPPLETADLRSGGVVIVFVVIIIIIVIIIIVVIIITINSIIIMIIIIIIIIIIIP